MNLLFQGCANRHGPNLFGRRKDMVVLMDKKIRDCMNCPLRPSITNGACGRMKAVNMNSGMVYRKYPDHRCMVKKEK